MFGNRYLHLLDVNISHVELHDFPQLESTQETDSIDVFLKINCRKQASLKQTKHTAKSRANRLPA